jgi:hypothetical protein
VEATRSSALVDLIDRILDKGVLLHADIIISVSGIPLIGVNLKAAIAGMKTMLDYGMMEAWDKTLRRQASQIEEDEQVPLVQGEKIILKTFGEVLTNFGTTHTNLWHPGYLYLTNDRLLLFTRKPPTIIFEASLDKINGTAFKRIDHIGGVRKVLSVHLVNGTVRYLHTNGIIELRDEIKRAKGERWLTLEEER